MELHGVVSQGIRKFYENHKSAYKGDAGIDLFIPDDITIPPKVTFGIDLQISCELIDSKGNNRSYLMLQRSSSGSKTPLRLANSIGLIDAEYRDTLKIYLDNISDQSYELKRGDRIVQIVAPNLKNMKFVLVDKLSETNRGSGFGSSGLSGKVE